MKTFALYPILQLLIIFTAVAQTTPRVAILYPNTINATEEIKQELSVYENQMELTDEMKRKFVNPDLPEHWQTNRSMLLDFMKEQDFFSLTTSSTSNQLTYLLNSAHEVLLCFPLKDTSSASKTRYMELCNQYGVEWIVNYTSIELSAEDETTKIEANLQLYNNISDHIWIDKTYTGVGSSTCEMPLWECALGNLVAQTSSDIHELLERKRHYWIMHASKD